VVADVADVADVATALNRSAVPTILENGRPTGECDRSTSQSGPIGGRLLV